MIKSSRNSTVIYIDHEVNPVIAAETKLSTTNINKLNLKLIRASTYLSQFRFDVRHRFGKSNVIPNALSRLSVKATSKAKGSLDIDAKDSKIDRMYAQVTTLIEMAPEFRKKLIKDYDKDSA